jgi:hypothetical protein
MNAFGVIYLVGVLAVASLRRRSPATGDSLNPMAMV